MTKKEKIKEAWQECMPEYKNFDEDGFSKDLFEYNDIDIYSYRTKMYLSGCYIRPYSLDGIENNNGWKKIENEYDIPKLKGECFVIDTNNIIQIMNYRNLFDRVEEGWAYTHYQPIIKPKIPVF